MTPSPMITIDEAIAQLDALRATLAALRLMPETMPANPVDLAMTAALRGLNFTERQQPYPGTEYQTDDLAGFDRIGVAWSEQYAFHCDVITVRVLGYNRHERYGYDLCAGKLIEIPRCCVTGATDFQRNLFAMIAVPAHFEPIAEGNMARCDHQPMTWPKPGMAYWWDEEPEAYRKQTAKGDPLKEAGLVAISAGSEPLKPIPPDVAAKVVAEFKRWREERISVVAESSLGTLEWKAEDEPGSFPLPGDDPQLRQVTKDGRLTFQPIPGPSEADRELLDVAKTEGGWKFVPKAEDQPELTDAERKVVEEFERTGRFL